MELLERYLLQIRRYLPLKERDETIEELRSLVLDQVDGHPAEDKEKALREILVNMGEPREVALRYNDKGPIISREMEPIMTLVMKIVSITLPLVILFANSLAFLTQGGDPNFFDFLLNLVFAIPSAFYSLAVAIGMIFIIFAIIERYANPQFVLDHKEFIPELLPELPKKEFKVSVLGSVITILVNILILYLANLHLSLFAVYNAGQTVPIFNDNINPYIILLSVGWILTIFLHIYYLYRQRKDLITRTIEYLLAIYGAVVIILIGTSDVFNDIIINGTDLNIVTTILGYVLPIAGVMAIIGSTFDYLKMYINLEKLDSLQQTKK